MNIELNEEERRYAESGEEKAKTLDSRVLQDPVRVLKRKPPVNAAPDDSLLDTVKAMRDQAQGCAVVVDASRVVGIFTERDALTRVVAEGADAASLKVSDVMTPDPECLTLDDTLGVALHKMTVGGFRHVPVVDADGLPVGVISQREGVQYLVGFFPEEVLNQPPKSIAQRPPRKQHGG